MNRKNMGIGLLIMVVLAVIVYGMSTMKDGGGEVTATLTIETGESHSCEATLPAGSTVVDFMEECGVSFTDEGGFFTSIQDISQDEATQTYWMYYVNGEMAPVGAREYVVQDGDEITWKLESYS
jgi:hypothetical protein